MIGSSGTGYIGSGCAVSSGESRTRGFSQSLHRCQTPFAGPAFKASGLDHEADKRRLKRELARVTEERDTPRKASRGAKVARVPEPRKRKTGRVRVHRDVLHPQRKPTNNVMLSPVDFETQQQKLYEAIV